MRLGLRLLFAFFVIVGLAGFFALQVFESEVKPSAREVMEDVLADTANLLAEQAAADLRALPPGGTLQDSRLAQQVAAYRRRPVDIQIWGLHKRTLDLRVYVTDASGRVVLDSGFGPEAPASAAGAASSALGADYSRWRDVALTLRGQYGARATRTLPEDDTTSVMYVAAPVRDGDRVIGVVALAVTPFFERPGFGGRVVTLVVDEKARGLGVGRRLLADAEEAARVRGCVRMEITSARRREDAHAFYRAAGYTDWCDRAARFLKDLD